MNTESGYIILLWVLVRYPAIRRAVKARDDWRRPGETAERKPSCTSCQVLKDVQDKDMDDAWIELQLKTKTVEPNSFSGNASTCTQSHLDSLVQFL